MRETIKLLLEHMIVACDKDETDRVNQLNEQFEDIYKSNPFNTYIAQYQIRQCCVLANNEILGCKPDYAINIALDIYDIEYK